MSTDVTTVRTTGFDRTARTRIRVGPDPSGGRCRVRTALTRSDATAAGLRPFVVAHDDAAARISLVPDGALLLAGDAVEIDVTVDDGARLDLVEPGGTVAFAMRGGRAGWRVRIRVGAGAVLTWAGEPFVVAEGAEVDRHTSLTVGTGARVAIRETLALGRHGERPGVVRQRLTATDDAGAPLLVEELPLGPDTASGLLGGHRVVGSVLLLGAAAPAPDGPDRYPLDSGGVLWRRLGAAAHEAALPDAWAAATEAVGSDS